VLHNDIGFAATSRIPSGERFHWYSSTGWIMWNCQVNGPCSPARRAASSTAAPAGSKEKAGLDHRLWRFRVRHQDDVSFGAGRRGLLRQLRQSPKSTSPPVGDLSTIAGALGSTGLGRSPRDTQDWFQ